MQKMYLLSTVISVTAMVCTAVTAFASDGQSPEVETNAILVSYTENDLPVEPQYGANPDYDVWTTVVYTVEDLNQDLAVTVSADAAFEAFEIQCNFFEDHCIRVTKNEDEYEFGKTTDVNGFLNDMIPVMIENALQQDIWLSTDDCSIEYIDVLAAYDAPNYIVAGVYDEDFERSNDNLNHMIDMVDDEKITSYKVTENERHGSVETVVYDTYYYALDAYNGDAESHETPIQKTAYVYLPYDYDENVSYNIIYLLHGGGDTASKWFSQMDSEDGELGEGYAVNILDNMFANGDAQPCIVVTPGLYYEGAAEEELEETSVDFTTTFSYELRDLIPVIETEYSTYAEGNSQKDLTDSRSHRALIGLSMGSITTWNSGIAKCLDLFSWYGNMSAGPSADVEEAVKLINESIIPALVEGEKNGYNVDLMLSFDGTHDMALEPHVAAHHALEAFASESSILTVGDNYDFVTSDGVHQFNAWNLYLYDFLLAVFK